MQRLFEIILISIISFILGVLCCFLYTYQHFPALGSLAEWLSGVGTTGTVIFAWKNIYDREVPQLEISCMDLNDTKRLNITNKSDFAITLTEIELSSDSPNGYRIATTLPSSTLPDIKKGNIYSLAHNDNRINKSTGGIILDSNHRSCIIDVKSKYFNGSDKIRVRDSSGYKYTVRTKKVKKALKKDPWTDKRLILKRY